MLIAAGDNNDRVRNDAAFAKLCGVCPIPAGSGRTNGRHRLNRGGNRQANAALYRTVIVRMHWHPETIAYVERRTAEGLPKKEIIRCLKRYVARELYALLPATSTEKPLSRSSRNDLTRHRSINAMAEALKGTFKAELHELHGPWRTKRDLEIAIVEWIDWCDHRRLQTAIGPIPPAHYEADWYRIQQTVSIA